MFPLTGSNSPPTNMTDWSSVHGENVTSWEDLLHNGSTIDPGPVFAQRRPIFEKIDLYVTPIWYVLGIPGNALAVAVWIQRRMRPSSGCYLTALAIDEGVFLILQIFFELQIKWGISLLNASGLCEIFPVVFLTSQHLSPLLVLGFTVERYISVCHPFQRERFCTTRRALVSIGIIVTFSLLLNSVQGYFYRYDTLKRECSIRAEAVSAGPGSFWSVYSWITEMMIFGAVPLAILILNLFVIRETRRLAASQKVLVLHQQLSTGGHRGTGGSSKPSATTLTLLAVSFFLIFTTLPVTIIYVLYVTFEEGDTNMRHAERWSDPTWMRHRAYNEIRTIVEEIGLSHYACNFYIYLCTGKLFRRELKTLLSSTLCWRRRGWAEIDRKNGKMRSGGSGYSTHNGNTSVSVL